MLAAEHTRVRKYGDLRNAIVHDRGYPTQVIAEPSEEALHRFETIVAQNMNPKRLDAFSRKLHCFSTSDQLISGLRLCATTIILN